VLLRSGLSTEDLATFEAVMRRISRARRTDPRYLCAGQDTC